MGLALNARGDETSERPSPSAHLLKEALQVVLLIVLGFVPELIEAAEHRRHRPGRRALESGGGGRRLGAVNGVWRAGWWSRRGDGRELEEVEQLVRLRIGD